MWVGCLLVSSFGLTMRANPSPSRKALERDIVRCGQSKNPAVACRQALALMEQLREMGDEPPSARVVNSAAAVCTRAGQLDRTFSLLNELDARGGWDSHSFTAAITAHGKRRQWRAAVELVRTMERRARAQGEGSPVPNEFVYGAAIGACATAGRWVEAMGLLEEMDRRGIPSNARCYNGALSACDRADQPEAALQLFEKMRTGIDERIRPTTISYTSAISACSRRPAMAARSPALLSQVREASMAFHWPSMAFHWPSTAFHWPSMAFHWPSTAFHWPSTAFR